MVLNFWASWCVPCRRVPAFEAAWQQVGERVAFVGIKSRGWPPAALRLLDETGVTYPAGHDPQGTVPPPTA